MIKSFQMSKKEMVVLFELIDLGCIMTGISDLPEISEEEFEEIKKSFVDNGFVLIKSEKAIPCKVLEKFLIYIDRAERILIFNHGVLTKCDFNATLYFSSKGMIGVLELEKDNVEFIVIESLEELMLFLPNFGEVYDEAEQYLSYSIFDKESMLIHFAGLEENGKMVKVFERRQDSSGNVSEEENHVKFQTYTDLLHGKLKEVYNVTCS